VVATIARGSSEKAQHVSTLGRVGLTERGKVWADDMSLFFFSSNCVVAPDLLWQVAICHALVYVLTKAHNYIALGLGINGFSA
jgi:hypothetical protein